MSVLKIRDENGNWIGIPSIKGEDGKAEGFALHSSKHAKGAEDAISPASIGAATVEELEAVSGVANEAKTKAETGITNAANAEIKASEALDTATVAIGDAATARTAANDALNVANSKAPMYTLGTADIEAGSPSTEPEGSLHFVYE